MPTENVLMRVAIVGSGIAGLTCALRLSRHHQVTVFEADHRLGGHANTVAVDDPEVGPLGIDTGFIVHNDRNYPNLVALFDELGVATKDSEMSFAVTDRATGFHYRATNPNTLFAQRRNLISPAMWRMVVDIARFYRHANAHLAAVDTGRAGPEAEVGPEAELSLAEFLDRHRYSATFRDLHLIPMGAAVWSADPGSFDAFPATSLFRFLANHGLLGVGDRPQWRTVVGGSVRYVAAVADAVRAAPTGCTFRTGTPVRAVHRHADGVDVITDADGSSGVVLAAPGAERIDGADRSGGRGRGETFDRVVLACHSDQALRLLVDPSSDERTVLGAIGYQPNEAVLHTDVSLLPPTARAWAAWNYDRFGPDDDRATLTYDLTTLQRLAGARRYLVTLNGGDRPDPATVLGRFAYAHPVFDGPAVAAQARFDRIDGGGGVHFCGAYWGYGFHEDGMVSGLRVVENLDRTVAAA